VQIMDRVSDSQFAADNYCLKDSSVVEPDLSAASTFLDSISGQMARVRVRFCGHFYIYIFYIYISQVVHCAQTI